MGNGLLELSWLPALLRFLAGGRQYTEGENEPLPYRRGRGRPARLTSTRPLREDQSWTTLELLGKKAARLHNIIPAISMLNASKSNGIISSGKRLFSSTDLRKIQVWLNELVFLTEPRLIRKMVDL